MKILLLEPYFTGSHASWAREYAGHSQHKVDILSMSGQFWKWRMHGGAVTLARKFLSGDYKPDLLLTTDMLDLPTFLALTRHITASVKTAVYFHENQLTYPWSPMDRDLVQQRDMHYSFINYTSGLTADLVLFNSHYHLNSFFDELPRFLKSFPDQNELNSVSLIRHKSRVLHLGMDLKKLDLYQPAENERPAHSPPLILWNHRWEYDKNPEDFFKALYRLDEEGLGFEVAVLGECFSQKPQIFLDAREKLGTKIVQFGFVKDFDHYAAWLWKADIVPVTSMHDFFGGSVVQAMHCNCYPLLPTRLAYPEHIPADFHSRFFYNDFDDLVERLKKLIATIQKVRQENIQTFVTHYDWQKMAPLYDDILGELVENDKSTEMK